MKKHTTDRSPYTRQSRKNFEHKRIVADLKDDEEEFKMFVPVTTAKRWDKRA